MQQSVENTVKCRKCRKFMKSLTKRVTAIVLMCAVLLSLPFAGAMSAAEPITTPLPPDAIRELIITAVTDGSYRVRLTEQTGTILSVEALQLLAKFSGRVRFELPNGYQAAIDPSTIGDELKAVDIDADVELVIAPEISNAVASDNRIIITTKAKGEFGFQIYYHIPRDDFAKVYFIDAKVLVFGCVLDKDNVPQYELHSEITMKNDTQSHALGFSTSGVYIIAEKFPGLGDVNGDGKIDTADVLEILKWLVNMSSVIPYVENNPNATKSYAWHAATIMGDKPSTADALEILKRIVGLLNKIDIPYLDDVQMKPSVTLERGWEHTIWSDVSARYESSNDKVAIVQQQGQNGLVTAVDRGNASIFVYANNRLSKIQPVRVTIPTQTVVVSTVPQRMAVGSTHQVTVDVFPRDTTDTLELSSSNPTVASIAADGTIKALTRGDVTISVKSGHVLRTFRITVFPITTAVEVIAPPTYMTVGERHRLSARTIPADSTERIDYSSSNEWVLRVSRDGDITAAAAGTAVITVRSGSVTQSYTVTVEAPVITNTRVDSLVGWEHHIGLNGTARTVTWSSSNPTVATVSDIGVVTVHAPGYTCIIASVGGFDFHCDIYAISHFEQQIASLQAKYPSGYFWNRNTPDPTYPNVSTIPCNHAAGVRACIGQCAGYAELISNEIFGVNAPRHRNITDASIVKAGDYVRYGDPLPNGRHSIIVIRVVQAGEIVGYDRNTKTNIHAPSGYWLVTDCNWMSDCGIQWYRRFDYNQVFASRGGLIPNLSYSRY